MQKPQNNAESKAKEKAQQLTQKYFDEPTEHMMWNQAVLCALIAVEEILNAHFLKRDSGYKTYWLNVKNELNKLL